MRDWINLSNLTSLSITMSYMIRWCSRIKTEEMRLRVKPLMQWDLNRKFTFTKILKIPKRFRKDFWKFPTMNRARTWEENSSRNWPRIKALRKQSSTKMTFWFNWKVSYSRLIRDLAKLRYFFWQKVSSNSRSLPRQLFTIRSFIREPRMST